MFQFPLLITAHLINTNLEEGMVRSNAIGMGKRGGEKIRGSKGSYNSRTNSNRIEKRIEKEKRQQQPLRIISEDQPRYHGYIFMCNGDTKTDCFKYKVFGLPASRLDVLEKIHPQMKLFLFDFDLRLLYGIFLPASRGEMSLEPTAFGGKFSAQVRFQIYEDCLPLPESVFKPIIRDNYQGSKFRQELSEEHVQNLISLFRPVAMSPSQSVVPLMPAAHSLEQRDEPPGFEVYPRPGAGISASRNQDLAGLHVVHASAVKLHGRSLPTVHDAQPQLRQCYSTGAPPDYFPALPERELYNRYVALPREDQEPMIDRNVVAQAHPNLPSQLSTSFLGHEHLPTKSLSAAYWISVANESLRKEMDPPSHQSTPSASTGMVVPTQCPPLEGKETAMIFQHPQTEIDDSSSAANNVLVGQPPAENCPAHLPTSSSLVLGYWTPVSFQDPNQVYSAPSQRQQVASTGLSTVNIPTSVVQTDLAPGFYSLLETGGNQYVPSRGTTFDYYNYGTKTGANDVPVQVCDSTSYYSGTISVPAQARDPTAEPYTANSSVPAQPGDPAAYYSATTDVPAQAGDLAAYYLGTTSIPAQARDPVVTYYSASIDVPASAGDLAAYYVGTNSVPAQAHDPAVAYYHSNTGIPAPAHDIPAYYSAATGIPGQAHHQGACYYPENLYGHTHLPSSSQAPAYWDSDQVGVAYFPQSILPSGNSSSNVGDGHLNISLAGTATIGPLDGL